MKKYIIIFLVLLSIQGCSSKKLTIDNLNTNRKVSRFLKQNINERYTYEHLFYRTRALDEEDFNESVKKIDINNDGFVDLIVEAYETIVVLDLGNNSYKELRVDLSNSPFHHYDDTNDDSIVLDTIIDISNRKILIFNHEDPLDYSDPNVNFDKSPTITKIDSLSVKYNQLLIYKNSGSLKDLLKVKKIEFETTNCYGSCPVFKLKIENNGNFNFTGVAFNNIEGIKIGQLEIELKNDLFGIIEYAELTNLNNSYSVNWTDDQTVTLKVFFVDGTVKIISDYGKNGSRSLKSIYEKLFEIKDIINLD